MTRRCIGRQAQMLFYRTRGAARLGEGRDRVHMKSQLGARRALGDDRQRIGRIRPVDPRIQRHRRQLQRHAFQRPAQGRGIRQHPPLQHHRGRAVLQIGQDGGVDRFGIVALHQRPQIPGPAFGVGWTRGEDRLYARRAGIQRPRHQLIGVEMHQRLDWPILQRLLGRLAPFEGGRCGEAHARASPPARREEPLHRFAVPLPASGAETGCRLLPMQWGGGSERSVETEGFFITRTPPARRPPPRDRRPWRRRPSQPRRARPSGCSASSWPR